LTCYRHLRTIVKCNVASIVEQVAVADHELGTRNEEHGQAGDEYDNCCWG